MRSVEIFSGTGGLAKGLELAGFDHVAFIENNKHACNSLEKNFSKNKIFSGDARDYDFASLSNIDLVAGGPPCQPFSLGGKHKAENDHRDMFPTAINAIRTLAPKAFIFENVKGLLRKTFSDYFDYILLRLTYPDKVISNSQLWRDHLEDLKKINPRKYSGTKYDVSYALLNAADYGVPQIRQRVVIVGIRSDLNKTWEFPQPTHSKESLIWDQQVSGNYWTRHKLSKTKQNTKQESSAQIDFLPPSLKPWQTIRDALRGVPEPNERHSIADHIFREGARVYSGHTGSYIDLPAKTIKAGGHGVPGGENMIRYQDGSVRYLTVYEAKLIQTFPQNFVITGAWGEALRQIGNAVPVKLAQVLGEKLAEVISEFSAETMEQEFKKSKAG